MNRGRGGRKKEDNGGGQMEGEMERRGEESINRGRKGRRGWRRNGGRDERKERCVRVGSGGGTERGITGRSEGGGMERVTKELEEDTKQLTCRCKEH